MGLARAGLREPVNGHLNELERYGILRRIGANSGCHDDRSIAGLRSILSGAVSKTLSAASTDREVFNKLVKNRRIDPTHIVGDSHNMSAPEQRGHRPVAVISELVPYRAGGLLSFEQTCRNRPQIWGQLSREGLEL